MPPSIVTIAEPLTLPTLIKSLPESPKISRVALSLTVKLLMEIVSSPKPPSIVNLVKPSTVKLLMEMESLPAPPPIFFSDCSSSVTLYFTFSISKTSSSSSPKIFKMPPRAKVFGLLSASVPSCVTEETVIFLAII